MFRGEEIASTLAAVGVSHVVWLPDSELGRWEPALANHPKLSLLRVCREGEAWALAAGLHIGGKRPIVMIQSTGLFESGDALRNVLFDLGVPLVAVIGYRSYLVDDSPDTARRFTEPVLRAWGIDYRIIACEEDKPLLAEHYTRCTRAQKPGALLIAEGRM